MSKIMRVYYDNAGYPYKDSALSIRYPILEGGEFTGANNTTEIHFYTSNIGEATWVANCKLPNGTLVNRLLVSAVDGNGYTYQNLPLDSELTSVVGHLKIGLNGYYGNISIDEEELENNDLVVISGTPSVVATGIIDIAMNYSPVIIPISDLTPTEYQQLLSLIGSKADVSSTILVVDDISLLSASSYDNGQIIYNKANKTFYRVVDSDFDLETAVSWGNIGGTLTNQADLVAALNAKQDTLVSGTNIKTINNQSLVGSGNLTFTADHIDWGNIIGDLDDQSDLVAILNTKENISNKVTSLSNTSTDTQYPSAKAVYDDLVNVREVAEGKTKSYIIDEQSDITGTKGSDDQYTNVTAITGVTLSDLKIGDVILIKDVNVPDYWVSQITPTYSLSKLETTKVDLTNYVDLTSAQTITGVKTFDSDIYGTYWKIENNPNYFAIRRRDGNAYILYASTDNTYIRSVLPITTATYNLGSSDYKWNNLYLSGVAYVGNATLSESSNNLNIALNGTNRYQITGSGILPSGSTNNNILDLGSSSRLWKNLYLGGSLSDGTYSYSIAESYGSMFNLTDTGTTEIKWSKLLTFTLSADTTFTFETAPTSCYPEYKAIITNSGNASITLTFTGISHIICNDGNISTTTNTIVLPTATTIEVSAVNGNLVAVNFEA